METKMAKRVLICYASSEQNLAEQLIDGLKVRGFEVTSYHDQSDSLQSTGIQQIDDLVIILSDNALTSESLRSTVTMLIDRANNTYSIISLFLSPSSLLNQWDVLRYYPSLLWYPGGYDDIFTRLLNLLEAQTLDRPTLIFPASSPENTYPMSPGSDTQPMNPVFYQPPLSQKEKPGVSLINRQIVERAIVVCVLLFVFIFILRSVTNNDKPAGLSSSPPSLVPTSDVPSPTLAFSSTLTPVPTLTTPVSTPSPSITISGNFITNPGFETGDLSGWICDAEDQVISGQAHSGTYALQITPTSSSYGQCSQTVSVQPEHTYTLSAYVNGSYVFIGIVNGASTWTSTSSYTQLNVSVSTGSSTSLTIYIHGWYGQGNTFVDDVALQ
jgi:Carbohydrate binding domain